MVLHASGEDYLETILILQQKTLDTVETEVPAAFATSLMVTPMASPPFSFTIRHCPRLRQQKFQNRNQPNGDPQAPLPS